MKSTIDFRFKSLTADKYAKLLETVDTPAEAAKQFTVEEKDGAKIYKRNPFAVEVSLPDWLANIPQVAQDAIKDGLVKGFILDKFVENFQPVGSFDWAAIESWATETGGRKRLEFSDELLAECAGSFGAYIAQATGNKAVGERMKETAAAKFSMAAFQKHLNQSDEDIIKRVAARLSAWAEWIANNNPEKADEYAPVYSYLHGRLQKNIEKLSDIPENIADIL